MNLSEIPSLALEEELARRDIEDQQKFWRLFLQVTEKILEIVKSIATTQPIETVELTNEEYEFGSQEGIATIFRLKGIDGEWAAGSDYISFNVGDKELLRVRTVN